MDLRSVAAAASLGALAACGANTNPPVWHQESGYRWQDLRVSGSRGDVGFARMDPGKTGIRFQNSVSDSALG